MASPFTSAGAQAGNWNDPASVRGQGATVRLVAGVPTGRPVQFQGDPGNPAHVAATATYAAKVRSSADWLRSLATNIPTDNPDRPSQDDVLKAVLALRPDQVLVAHGVLENGGVTGQGIFHVAARAALPTAALDALTAAEALARVLPSNARSWPKPRKAG